MSIWRDLQQAAEPTEDQSELRSNKAADPLAEEEVMVDTMSVESEKLGDSTQPNYSSADLDADRFSVQVDDEQALRAPIMTFQLAESNPDLSLLASALKDGLDAL